MRGKRLRRPYFSVHHRSLRLRLRREALAVVLTVMATSHSWGGTSPLETDLKRYEAETQALQRESSAEEHPQDARQLGAHGEARLDGISLPGLTLRGAITLYQRLLSSQDQPACNFTPTCSHFAQEAIRLRGPFLGVLMGSDRLQRCVGAARKYYPTDPSTGRASDPVPTAASLSEMAGALPASGTYFAQADAVRGLAESLRLSGEYREAAVEYQRYLLSLGDDRRAEKESAWLQTIACYRQAKRPQIALRQLDSLDAQPAISDSTRCRSCIERARCLHLEGRTSAALNQIRQCSAGCARWPNAIGDLALLAAAEQMRLHQWDEVTKLANGTAVAEGPERQSLARLEALASRARTMRNPRPIVAGLLSTALPGAGRVYAGRFAEGIYSFVLLALASWQCADGFHDDGGSSAKGWTAGSIGLLLYFGDIYGSATTAKRVRAARIDELLHEADMTVERGMSP